MKNYFYSVFIKAVIMACYNPHIFTLVCAYLTGVAWCKPS